MGSGSWKRIVLLICQLVLSIRLFWEGKREAVGFLGEFFTVVISGSLQDIPLLAFQTLEMETASLGLGNLIMCIKISGSK